MSRKRPKKSERKRLEWQLVPHKELNASNTRSQSGITMGQNMKKLTTYLIPFASKEHHTQPSPL